MLQPTLGVAVPESALLYTILCPVGSYFKGGSIMKPVSLLADPRFVRAWPGGCGDRKLGSNYGPTIHIQVWNEKQLYYSLLELLKSLLEEEKSSYCKIIKVD